MKKFLTLIILIGISILSLGIDVKADVTFNTNIIDDSYSSTNRFSAGLAMSSDFLAVGAEELNAKGSVNIYSTTDMSLIRTIANPTMTGTSTTDYYSQGLAIYGTHLISSAPREDYLASSSGTVYVHSIATGALLYTIQNPNVFGTPELDMFGTEVGASDLGYIAVGAPNEDMTGYLTSGAVYIFNANDNYSLLHTLENPNAYDTPATDYFGKTLDVYGNYLAVGTPDEDIAGYSSSGVVYLYDITTGVLLHTFYNENTYGTESFDQFGNHVAVSDDFLAVGALYEDTDTFSNAGVVYVYDINTYELVYTINNPNFYGTPASDTFGNRVGLTSEYLMATAVAETDIADNTFSGAVYLFDLSTGLLEASIANPNIYGDGLNDYFGYRAVIHDYNLVVGAFLEDVLGVSDSGIAYSYILDPLIPIFDVTFNTNGGNIIAPLIGIEVGSFIPIPSDPVKNTYTFLGWYSDEDFYHPFDMTIDLMPENDLTLYAKWVQDIEPSINDTLDSLGLADTASKVILGVVLIILAIFGTIYFKPSPYITLLLVVALLLLFISFGWIPIWIVILLAIILFGILFITIKGGGN